MIQKCHECWGMDGSHWPNCLSRGYAYVGPHPDATPSTQRAPVDPTPCPCGIARLDCEYHKPAAVEPFEYGAFDCSAPTPGTCATWRRQHVPFDACFKVKALADFHDAHPDVLNAEFVDYGDGTWSVRVVA